MPSDGCHHFVDLARGKLHILVNKQNVVWRVIHLWGKLYYFSGKLSDVSDNRTRPQLSQRISIACFFRWVDLMHRTALQGIMPQSKKIAFPAYMKKVSSPARMKWS
jgi:hypothetical protein